MLLWLTGPNSVLLFRSRTSNVLDVRLSASASTHFRPRKLLCSFHASVLFSGGGNVRIETVKLDFRDKAQAKVGSLENAHHTPGGGQIMVSEQDYQNGSLRCSGLWILRLCFGSLTNSKPQQSDCTSGTPLQFSEYLLPTKRPTKALRGPNPPLLQGSSEILT